MLALINCFRADASASALLSEVSLLFSPIKLVLLIAWVYLCLYVVQRLQFSSLVPENRRSIAAVIALFVGPLLLLVLLSLDVARRAARSDRGILEIIKERLHHFSTGTIQDDSTIILLDPSGRNIEDIYGQGKHADRHTNRILDLTQQIIYDALQEKASDILIDPLDKTTYTLRLRVDGMLRSVEQIDSETCQAVINSIKALSNMDIAERRRPQDGSFTAQTRDGTYSFRAASAGVLNGEKLSLRVLSHNTGAFTLDRIGFSKKQCAVVSKAINKPSGMILLCGPTGSGKTTTLYAMLNEIDLFTRNVITVEDPIEYVLPNASQIEINPKADITFAKSLRSILRQDPDVICIGEIRDEETAEIALRASQTGHLVVATIHSNSNASALVRLLDLGVSRLMIASGLNYLVSQRLVRRLCDDCKFPAELTQNQIREFRRKRINYANMCNPEGCEQCHFTGYRGRTAVFDILVLTNQIRTRIADSDGFLSELRKEGEQKGRSNLYKQGLKRVVLGITSLDELKRVLG